MTAKISLLVLGILILAISIVANPQGDIRNMSGHKKTLSKGKLNEFYNEPTSAPSGGPEEADMAHNFINQTASETILNNMHKDGKIIDALSTPKRINTAKVTVLRQTT